MVVLTHDGASTIMVNGDSTISVRLKKKTKIQDIQLRDFLKRSVDAAGFAVAPAAAVAQEFVLNHVLDVALVTLEHENKERKGKGRCYLRAPLDQRINIYQCQTLFLFSINFTIYSLMPIIYLCVASMKTKKELESILLVNAIE
ncbi:hypothetical protein ACJX0J_030285 [Zea mays]